MVIDYKSRQAYFQDYYRRNRDRINKMNSEYIKNHSEERKEYRRLRYLQHREQHLARVKARQKKYFLRWYSYLAERTEVKWKNYKDKFDEAKTQWERNEVRKKFRAARSSAIACKKKAAKKRLERDKAIRKARREARVQESIQKFLSSKNNPHETQTNSEPTNLSN